jgi:hypothetical protein
MKQTMMTQIFDESSSSDSDFEKKPKKKIKISKVASKLVSKDRPGYQKRRLKSICPIYMADATTPKLGDLVMTTLGDISHPAIMQSGMSKNYLLFGTVNSFELAEGGWRAAIKKNLTFEEYAAGEMLKVNWMTVEEKGVRYIALTNDTPAFEYPVDEFEEEFIFLPSVKKTIPQIVAKKASKDLSPMNGFIKDTVYEHFQFGTNRGWSLRK